MKVGRLDCRSAGRRRWPGQFLGQFLGDGRGNAGNLWNQVPEFEGQSPVYPRIDVIIKCRVYLYEGLQSTDSVEKVGHGFHGRKVRA
jgi:hypothetical protein